MTIREYCYYMSGSMRQGLSTEKKYEKEVLFSKNLGNKYSLKRNY